MAGRKLETHNIFLPNINVALSLSALFVVVAVRTAYRVLLE